MATLPPAPSPHLINPFPSQSVRASQQSKPLLSFPARATTDPQSSEPESTNSGSPSDTDPFESRLSKVRRRYRIGAGKKAEIRKSKKAGSMRPKSSMYLPPVPLKEPTSGGLKVDFGFSPYSERLNGRLAILGLTALLLVELATGKSVINYHSPPIVLIQTYFAAAATALFVKYEKEKVSIWPRSSNK